MKLKYLSILIFILVCTSVNSQSAEYTVEDFTDRMSPLKISYTPLGFGFTGINLGLRAEGATGRFGYNVILHSSYSIFGFTPNNDDVVNPENFKHSKSIEAGIDYFFINNFKPNKARVKVIADRTISFNADSYSFSDKVFYAKCDKRKLTGLHAGFLHYNSRDVVNNSDEYWYKFETVSGMPPINDVSRYHFNNSNTFLFTGLVFKKIIKNTVHRGGWNYYNHYSRRIYTDLLIGGSSREQITIGANTYALEPKDKSPMGYRIGFQWDEMGWITKFEMGKLPQMATTRFGLNYFLLDFSVNIFRGDKRYPMYNKFRDKKQQ